MGKNRDLIQILLVVIIGMLIPFLGSMILTFGLDVKNISDLLKVIFAFGYFLLFFGVELFVVFLYYRITSKTASKKMDKYRPK